MNIVSATITGSLILNGVNISSITGSEASINALNLFTASAATTGSNQFNGNQTVTGSVNITGSLIVTGSIIGTVTTASYVLNAVSASYAANADLLDGRDSLTFANTGSNAFVGQQNINGSVAITGSLTTTGAITAQTLNVQQVTSSIVYSSGSNVFGNSVSNTQSMTGSVGISGSLAVVGALTGTTAAFTGKVTTTSNIGIGTTNPDIVGYGAGGILGINSTTSDASSIQIGMVGTSGATSGTLADINFFGKNETSLVITRSLIRSGLDGAINSNFISFHTQNAGSLAEKMRITKGGNLEIGYGATQGLYKLDVNGTGRFADALTGTSATFTGASGAHIGVTSTITDATGSSRFRATATGGNIVDMTVYSASHASRANQAWIGGDGSTTTTVLQSAGVEFLRGTSAGATTLAGALSGTSASFIVNQNSTITNSFQNTNTTNTNTRNILNVTAGNVTLQLQAINADNVYIGPTTAVTTYLGYNNLTTLSSTGAATFSSTVKAVGVVVDAADATGSYTINKSGVGKWVTYNEPTDNSYTIREFGVANRLVILPTTGNVGIGTTSPGSKFVASNGGAMGFEIDPTVSASVARTLIYNRGTSAYGNIENWALSHQFHVNGGTLALTLASTGAATFSGKTIVGSSSSNAFEVFSDGDTEIGFSYSTRGNIYAKIIGDITNASPLGGEIAFQTATGGTLSERMRITSGGFLKVSNDGTYQNTSGLYHEITGSTNNNNILTVRNTHATGAYGPYITLSGATYNNATNYIIGGGDAGGARFIIMSNGGLHNYSANDVNLSDETVKKDIFPMESQWEIFKNIEFSKFKYKDQTHDDFNYGVIAQQVLKVAPHFVNQDGFGSNKDLLSVYDSDIHYSSHKALQEALIRIENLENKITQLENK
jgi:hypothetical protein